jgi:hypothetical protein
VYTAGVGKTSRLKHGESSGEPSVINLCNSDSRSVTITIIGLVILVAAVVAGVVGVLSNGGSGYALTHPFAVFGYHVTGSPARCSSTPSWSGQQPGRRYPHTTSSPAE